MGARMEMFRQPHPGKVLQEFIGDTPVAEFARSIGITRQMLYRILNGEAGISAPVAVELERALQSSAQMWLSLQMKYDLALARRAAKKPRRVTKPVTKRAMAIAA